ncbi:hypothetical protein MMC14_009502 [Varicellaria rhodocarpa]|nr:hypothetical protein [Varicellaria rhodocarpa]
MTMNTDNRLAAGTRQCEYLTDELASGGTIPDTVALSRAVHEAHKDAVIIKEGGHISNAPHHELQVLDALPALLKGHGPAVIGVDDDVVQRQAGHAVGQLHGHVVLGCKAPAGIQTSIDSALQLCRASRKGKCYAGGHPEKKSLRMVLLALQQEHQMVCCQQWCTESAMDAIWTSFCCCLCNFSASLVRLAV